MQHNIKRISRNVSCLTIAVAVIGVGVILTSQSLLRSYNRETCLAVQARYLAHQIYAGGLQLGQATRNIVLNPADTKAVENHAKAIESIHAAMGELKLWASGKKENGIHQLLLQLEQGMQNDIAAQQEVHALAQGGQAKKAMDCLTSRETVLWRECKDLIFNALDWCKGEANRLNLQTAKQERVTDCCLWAMGLLLLLAPVFNFFIMRKAFNQAQTSIHSVGAVAVNIDANALKIAEMGQNLGERSNEQAASLEETSASLEKMAVMTKRNAESAQKAKDLSSQARTAASQGEHHVQLMNTSMDEIQTSSDEMCAAMNAVKSANDEVAMIIKTIDEIAFQTNILALNAAVEAARAGVAGTGFAVVAEEVRNLAQKSAQAARETAAKIEGAINRTKAGVQISEKVVVNLKLIVAQSKQVRQSLSEITSKTIDVDGLIGEISQASTEQSSGIEQIHIAVNHMDVANTATAEESSIMAREFDADAKMLNASVIQLMMLMGVKESAMGADPAPSAQEPSSQPSYVSSGERHTDFALATRR